MLDLKDISIENLPNLFPGNNNFEDYLGIHSILGSDLNSESTLE